MWALSKSFSKSIDVSVWESIQNRIKTSWCKISWSLEAARLVAEIVVLFWNLAGASAAILSRGQSNVKAIMQFWKQISRFETCSDQSVRCKWSKSPQSTSKMRTIWLCFVLLWSNISCGYMVYCPISIRVTSLALGQSYDCPSTSKVIPKEMAKIARCIWRTLTKHDKAWMVCITVTVHLSFRFKK